MDMLLISTISGKSRRQETKFINRSSKTKNILRYILVIKKYVNFLVAVTVLIGYFLFLFVDVVLNLSNVYFKIVIVLLIKSC